MIIFCREHGWQYNAIMCYKCNRADIIIPDEWPEKGISIKKTERAELLCVPCNSAKFRSTTLLEFL